MIESIEKIIKEKNFPNVLLMFGEEEFLLNEQYELLIREFISNDPSKSDFEIINAEETSPEKIVAHCSAFPFIADKRVVVINNFDKLFSGKVSKKTEQTSPFANYFNAPQKTTLLILKANVKKLNGLGAAFGSKRDKAKADKIISTSGFPYNLILNKHEWIEFPKIWENQFPGWVISRIRSFGKTISQETADLLVMFTNQNLRDISNEIDKLLIYIGGRKEITQDDINFLIGTNREFNVFELQKAIGTRNLSKAIKILENLLFADRKEMLIMTILVNYFTTLLKLIEESVKSNDKYKLAGVLRISPGFVQEYLNTIRLYTPQEIEKAFEILTEADLTLKTSSIDSLFVLEKMLIKIIDRN